MTDRIMTRILNEDNNVAMSSTFAQDLTVMSAMLNRATDRSLLIIDEFGKVRALTPFCPLLALCRLALCRLALCLVETHAKCGADYR